ncbi:MAG: hypothetical protein WDN47_02145 [Candidatus Doudnabacteria bacterium]
MAKPSKKKVWTNREIFEAAQFKALKVLDKSRRQKLRPDPIDDEPQLSLGLGIHLKR